MTAQMPDWVFYDNLRFSLEWDSSGKLPLLSELGVRPLNINTATRRGYEAEYEISDEQLYLIRLVVGSIEYLNTFKPVGDVSPTIEYNCIVDGKPNKDFGDVVYYLKYPMTISGTITLDCWGIDDRNLPPREQLKSDFEPKTLQLKLASGKVVKINDITIEANTIKKAMKQNYERMRQFVEQGKMRVIDNEFHNNGEIAMLRKKLSNLMQEELE